VVLVGVARLVPPATAVPAMGGGTGGAARPSISLYEWLFSRNPGLAREVLRAGLPLIAFVEDAEADRTRHMSFAAQISEFITGVNPEYAASILEGQFRVLAPESVLRTASMLRASGSFSISGAASATNGWAQDYDMAEVLVRIPGTTSPTPAPIVLPSSDPIVAIYHTHSKESPAIAS